uniref:Ig-like domain-containing protein n=1 Tax=Pseudonaja textilis TaxID=8673 RepID=A0A670ZR35_PSETE
MSSWCPSPYSSSPPKEERAGGARFPAEGRSARPVELLLPPPQSDRRVRFLYREMYDRQEFLRFDSDFGKHVVVTVLGEADAENFNSNKQFMQHQKAAVDHFCRHNYKVLNFEEAKREEHVHNKVRLLLDPASLNTILLCTARGFYPLEIEIQWLKNGKLEEEGVAFGEELQNGDWTYQLQVMLETQPQRGDIYNCQVGHISLEDLPVGEAAMDPPGGWRPRSSSSARSKLWTGIMGAVIGAVFLAVGLFSYLKSKKARSAAPSILGWRVERSP